MSEVPPIPEGFAPVTPHLVVRGAAQAITFYEKAFAARVVERADLPGLGWVLNATLEIGGGRLMIGDELPMMQGWVSPAALGGTSVALHIWTEDTDAAFARATEAGAKPVLPPFDAFWGDRYARVRDPYGHEWSLATRQRSVPAAEVAKAAAAFFGGLAGGGMPSGS